MEVNQIYCILQINWIQFKVAGFFWWYFLNKIHMWSSKKKKKKHLSFHYLYFHLKKSAIYSKCSPSVFALRRSTFNPAAILHNHILTVPTTVPTTVAHTVDLPRFISYPDSKAGARKTWEQTGRQFSLIEFSDEQSLHSGSEAAFCSSIGGFH